MKNVMQKLDRKYYRAMGFAAATAAAVVPGIASATPSAESAALQTQIGEDITSWLTWGTGIVTTVVITFLGWRMSQKIPNKTLRS